MRRCIKTFAGAETTINSPTRNIPTRSATAIKIKRSVFYSLAAIFFMVTTGSNYGPYSSMYGPYWLGTVFAVLGALWVLSPVGTMKTWLRPAVFLGSCFFAGIWLAALYLVPEYGLTMQLFGLLPIYTLAALLSAKEGGERSFAFATLLAVLATDSMNFYEFFIAPDYWSDAPGRAAGFFVNPNSSGTAISALLGIWLVMRSSAAKSWEMALVMLSLFAVFLTFSRGAVAVFAAVISTVLWLRARAKGKVRLSVVLLPIAIVIAVGMFLTWVGGQNLSADARLRMDSLLSGKFDDESSELRYDAAHDYYTRFLASPITGAEILGSEVDHSGLGPHNAYIAAAADFGIFGLIYYLAIMGTGALSARRLGWTEPRAQLQLVLAVWLAAASIFSHNVFYSPEGVMVMGLMLGSVSATSALAKRRRVQYRG